MITHRQHNRANLRGMLRKRAHHLVVDLRAACDHQVLQVGKTAGQPEPPRLGKGSAAQHAKDHQSVRMFVEVLHRGVGEVAAGQSLQTIAQHAEQGCKGVTQLGAVEEHHPQYRVRAQCVKRSIREARAIDTVLWRACTAPALRCP